MNRHQNSSSQVLSPRGFIVSAAIVALIWIVFGQTLLHDFVNYDDKTYVYGNPLVSAGLSLRGLAHAFVDTQTTNWHPLTTISHMLDCEMFGLKAGGHHFANVLLHTVAALLLLSWLSDVTGKFWRAAFVTAVFAIHPLRVESVAWIAERKDVLSAVFFFLTLILYTRYVRSPSIGRYVPMSIAFACGLMSKPMLVTTPALLLLLDYWPLGRLHRSQVTSHVSQIRGLVWEKVPLLALSFAASIVAIALQIHAPASLDQLPLTWRLENAVVSYWIYVQQIFWPANLAAFYPHPDDQLAVWQVAAAIAFLIAVTWIAFVIRKRHPYLLVGWLWYVIMLLPVIGIIQVGLQGHADRYTYLPQIGVCIALTWLIADLSTSSVAQKRIVGAVAAVVLIILTACSWKQTTYWRNSETLWTRALAVTKDNDVAHTNYGMFLLDHDHLDGALSHLQAALNIRSASSQSHYGLTLALIHGDIGNILERKGNMRDAISELRESSRLEPTYPDAHYNLGTILLQEGDIDGGIAELRTMLSLSPNDAAGHTSLANALVQKGLLGEAVDHYQKALRFDPNSVLALNNLAWLMAAGPDDSLRNNDAAITLAAKAARLSSDNNPIFVRTLAAACAQAGQFEKAMQTARHAEQLANAQGQSALAREITNDLDLYQRGQSLRDPTLRNAQ